MMRMTTGPGLLRGLGMRCRRPCACRVLLVFLVVVAFTQHQLYPAVASSGSSSGRVVTGLPGFDGRLPFHLETGYVEVDEDNGAELFYYFVESESGDADETPFLLWLTGGDRCSVFSGLVFEIGPIRFVLEPYNGTLPRLRYNQNSWSKLQLISEVQQAQVLLDTCVYASPVPNANSRTDASDGRRILREEIRVAQLNHPLARPTFGCITYGYYLSYFWANDRRTRDALGIKKGNVDEWVRCRDGDLPYSYELKSSIKYHRNLTSRGYRALVYSGDHDLLVPHLGTQAWVRLLNFSIVDDWRAWHLGGQSAGFTISYSNNIHLRRSRVVGIRHQSTSQRGASPCSAAGYSIGRSNNPCRRDNWT